MPRSAVVAAGLAGALLVGAAGAVGVAQADDPGSRDRAAVVVRHLQDREPVNTDIDLGEPGFGVGDMQLFTGRIFEGDAQAGTSAGTSQIVGVTLAEGQPKTITVSLTETVTFANGSVVLAGSFTEDLAAGPGPFVLAVTGGTAAYRTARGQLAAEILPDSNNTRETLTLILGR